MAKAKVKYCQNCGSENPVDQKFCGNCGYNFEQPKAGKEKGPSEFEQGSGLGVISLVTAILGFTCLPGIGLIIAMITGYITPNARKNTYAKAGTSIAVFVLGTVILVFSIIGIATYIGDGWIWPILLISIIGLIISLGAMGLQIWWLRKKTTT